MEHIQLMELDDVKEDSEEIYNASGEDTDVTTIDYDETAGGSEIDHGKDVQNDEGGTLELRSPPFVVPRIPARRLHLPGIFDNILENLDEEYEGDSLIETWQASRSAIDYHEVLRDVVHLLDNRRRAQQAVIYTIHNNIAMNRSNIQHYQHMMLGRGAYASIRVLRENMSRCQAQLRVDELQLEHQQNIAELRYRTLLHVREAREALEAAITIETDLGTGSRMYMQTHEVNEEDGEGNKSMRLKQVEHSELVNIEELNLHLQDIELSVRAQGRIVDGMLESEVSERVQIMVRTAG